MIDRDHEINDDAVNAKAEAAHAEWRHSEDMADARKSDRAEWLVAFKKHCCGFVPKDPDASIEVIVVELERHICDLYC